MKNDWTLPNKCVDVAPRICIFVLIYWKFIFSLFTAECVKNYFQVTTPELVQINLYLKNISCSSGAFTPEIRLSFRLPEHGSSKIIWTFLSALVWKGNNNRVVINELSLCCYYNSCITYAILPWFRLWVYHSFNCHFYIVAIATIVEPLITTVFLVPIVKKSVINL